MARKPGPGKCVHCLKEVSKRNWDHVFPVSWYPDSTPQNLEKWKIPSCKPCNDEYGKIEKQLGQILSMSIDPTKLESKGIYNRLRRGFDPKHAKNTKDRKARERERKRVLDEFIYGDDIPGEGIYPGLGERWERPRQDQVALRVPKKFIDQLGTKIVRGIAYLEDDNLIEDSHVIEHYAVEASGAVMFEDAITQFGHSLSRGPGIVVDRAVTQDDGISAIYKITIWGEFITYVSILPKEMVEIS